MKHILFTIFLFAFSLSQSQDLQYDFIFEIDQNNILKHDNQEISKRSFKALIKNYHGTKPHFQLNIAKGVDQQQIEKVKRLVSKEFSDFTMYFQFPIPVRAADGYLISGIVKDQNDQPLKHINVIATGTKKGLVTDERGRFEIRIPEDAKSLVVVHKDYKKYELEVSELLSLEDKENMKITLSPKKLRLF